MEKSVKKELALTMVRLKDKLLSLGIKELRIKLDEDRLLTYWNKFFDTDEQKIEGGIYPTDTIEDIERLY